MTFADASSPAITARAVTKSDTTIFERPSKALYIGGAGDVAVVMAEDTAPVTFSGVQAGSILPVRALKVMSTNTTATLILRLN